MERLNDFGVLYGQKTTEDALLIYSSYEDSKASPQTGDFIVLAPQNEVGNKFLARVEAEIYDEDPIFRSQDKTLIAVHYARIAERELSDRDKQKIFSYTYKVRILGTFINSGSSIKFTTAVRKLPTVSYHARHLNPLEVTELLNHENNIGIPIAIGNLCIGDEECNEKEEILFDIRKLRDKRTMIFAQSGFGKTNLMKVMLYHMISDKSYGKLIFDLDGEYCLGSKKTYGLGDINNMNIKNNLVVYTDRRIDDRYDSRFNKAGNVLIDTHKHLTIGDILNFGTGFSEVMKAFLLYLDDDGVTDFIENIDTYVSDPQQLRKKYPNFWDTKKDASATQTIAAIRKRLRHLIDEGKGIHSAQSNLIENTFECLKAGKTVIIDLSLKDNSDASIISTMIARKLFELNKENFTNDSKSDIIPTVMVIEEAQNVLSEEFVRSNANPFVRIAKEGRKFGIGIIAITQRPSAISEEIRTQAENFFVFHMGNSDDIKALIKSNINYDGVISNFIQRETIRGNLYMVSSNQAFALPVRVREFEKLVEKQVYPDSMIQSE
jgi:hypothetical protein